MAFASAEATGADWRSLVRTCASTLKQQAPDANIGFIYVTSEFARDLGAIADALRAATGVANWVGTVGLGIMGCSQEFFNRPAIVTLVGEFAEHAFCVVRDTDDMERVVTPADAPSVAFVHASPAAAGIAERVAQVANYPGGVFLLGGLASSNAHYLSVANGVTAANALSGVVFSKDVRISTRHTQGCTPLGPRREITRCKGNIVQSLDGARALDALYEDLGPEQATKLDAIGGHVFAALPIRQSDTCDYVVRNLMSIDLASGAIGVAEYLQEGATLMFCRRDPQAAEQDLRRMLTEIALDGPNPRAALYVSCLARGPNLFERSREVDILREHLGEIPLAGFFANGEIFNNRLYAYTGVLTLLM